MRKAKRVGIRIAGKALFERLHGIFCNLPQQRCCRRIPPIREADDDAATGRQGDEGEIVAVRDARLVFLVREGIEKSAPSSIGDEATKHGAAGSLGYDAWFRLLPVAMSCERNSIRGWWAPLIAITQITGHGDCRSDERICIDLLNRLCPEFEGKTEKDLLDWVLARSECPYDFDELTRRQYEYRFEGYRRYETGGLRPDGQPGFPTTTGLFELSSTLLAALGKHPVPFFEEPPESPYSSPELYEKYPLVLTTGSRTYFSFHSEHR